LAHSISTLLQETRLLLTNCATCLEVSQGHQTWYHWFPMCATVTLSVRHTVFEILDFKNALTLKTGLGVRDDH